VAIGGKFLPHEPVDNHSFAEGWITLQRIGSADMIACEVVLGEVFIDDVNLRCRTTTREKKEKKKEKRSHDFLV
jgi:hypothetical protein